MARTVQNWFTAEKVPWPGERWMWCPDDSEHPDVWEHGHKLMDGRWKSTRLHAHSRDPRANVIGFPPGWERRGVKCFSSRSVSSVFTQHNRLIWLRMFSPCRSDISEGENIKKLFLHSLPVIKQNYLTTSASSKKSSTDHLALCCTAFNSGGLSR